MRFLSQVLICAGSCVGAAAGWILSHQPGHVALAVSTFTVSALSGSQTSF